MSITRGIGVVCACVVAVALSLAVRSLQQQNDQVIEELTRIRQLLESLPGADRATLADVSGESLGRADAPLTMVEFTDLQCPYCREFHATAFEQIKRDYIDTGKLRYVARDFPLDTIHPLAIRASRANQCAGAQGKFWEMRHAILSSNRKLAPDSFDALARDLHLDAAAFAACTADTARLDARWQHDRAEGKRLGVSGTPFFVVGRTSPDGLVGVRLSGAKDYSAFDAKFKELLGS
jgi:protein-disulfide isomerase